jgi:putative flippase GtrA
VTYSRDVTDLLTSLWNRFQHLVHELGKFGVVGLTAFIVDAGVYNALLLGDLNTFLAKTISTSIAATLAFLGNRFWTWRHRARSGLHREYVLYFFFNAVGLGIGLSCLFISHQLLGGIWPVFQSQLADNLSALGVGMVLGTMFRFWSYKRFVFRALPTVQETPVTTDEAVPYAATHSGHHA